MGHLGAEEARDCEMPWSQEGTVRCLRVRRRGSVGRLRAEEARN